MASSNDTSTLWSTWTLDDDYEFCLTGIQSSARPAAGQKMGVVNIGDKHMQRGDDCVFFCLTLDPPLPVDDFFPYEGDASTLLRANVRGQRGQPLFSVLLDGPICVEERCKGPEGVTTFLRYPTHDVELVSACGGNELEDLSERSPPSPRPEGAEKGEGEEKSEKQEYAIRIFLTLENNQLSTRSGAGPLVQPRADMDTFYLAPLYGQRFRGLPYVPLDVHLRNNAIFYKPEELPQRIPPWYDMRGIFSGSSVGKNGAGYWVQRDAAVSAGQEKEKFTPEQRSSMMRMGRIQETDLVIIYLEAHPTHVFYEQGYVRAPHWRQEWGVSPDGLAVVPGQTWDDLPEQTRKDYAHRTPPASGAPPVSTAPLGRSKREQRRQKSKQDSSSPSAPTASGGGGGMGEGPVFPERVSLEFKMSQYSDKLPDYYLPQLYWEMIGQGAASGRLLRLKRRSDADPCHGSCKEYAVFRERATEELLVRNLERAWKLVYTDKTHTLLQLASSPEFEEARAHFANLAERTPGTNLRLPERLREYHQQRARVLAFCAKRAPSSPPSPLRGDGGGGVKQEKHASPSPPSPLRGDGGEGGDPLHHRHVRIREHLGRGDALGKERALELCAEQIEAYAQLIRAIF